MIIKDKSTSRIGIKEQNLNINNIIQSKYYNDFELNTLPYNEALKLDKRNYFQYYLSL